MSGLNCKKYLTWDDFLKEYQDEKFENNCGYYYSYGKTKLLLVILNKFILFLYVFSLVLFFVKNIYIQRSVLNIFILFLLFDIFIDETTFCIPICDILDKLYSECEVISLSSAKINISLKIDFTGNVDDEDKKEEKEENEDKDEEDFDDEYDIKTI